MLRPNTVVGLGTSFWSQLSQTHRTHKNHCFPGIILRERFNSNIKHSLIKYFFVYQYEMDQLLKMKIATIASLKMPEKWKPLWVCY